MFDTRHLDVTGRSGEQLECAPGQRDAAVSSPGVASQETQQYESRFAGSQTNGVLGSVHPGTIIRQAMLGSIATYRVRAVHDDLVDIEVLYAPGLRRGMRIRFARAVVQRMRLASSASEVGAAR